MMRLLVLGGLVWLLSRGRPRRNPEQGRLFSRAQEHGERSAYGVELPIRSRCGHVRIRRWAPDTPSWRIDQDVARLGAMRCKSCRARRLRNIDAFTDSVGVVHPIRGSKGYEAGVEQVQREARHERRLAATYGGYERAGRSDVQRPPWAIGISERQLARIARAHGASPYVEGWWNRAGLTSGSGEVRRVLEGAWQQRASGVGRVQRAAAERRQVRAARTRPRPRRTLAGSREYTDLPF